MKCLTPFVLLALAGPVAAQFGAKSEVFGSSYTMRQKTDALASHQDLERGRLASHITYLGKSAPAYSVVVRSTGMTNSYSVTVGGMTQQGYAMTTSQRVIAPTSANVFPSDVTKSYYLTTGTYTMRGNVVATGSLELNFVAPPPMSTRWDIAGEMVASATGSLRLINSWGTTLDWAADFGTQRLDGDLSLAWTGSIGVTYTRSTVDLRMRVVPRFSLFGTAWTFLSTRVNTFRKWPFIA